MVAVVQLYGRVCAVVRTSFLGCWVCGLYTEAVGDEIRAAENSGPSLAQRIVAGGAVGTWKIAEELMAVVSQLLRHCVDSRRGSDARTQGRLIIGRLRDE